MKITLEALLSYKLKEMGIPKTKEEWEVYEKLEEALLREQAEYDWKKRMEYEKLQWRKERRYYEEMASVYYFF